MSYHASRLLYLFNETFEKFLSNRICDWMDKRNLIQLFRFASFIFYFECDVGHVTPEFVLLTHLVGDQTADALKTHNLQIDIILISTVEIVPKRLQIMSGLTLICFQYHSMPFCS